jgi:hypothetical protein
MKQSEYSWRVSTKVDCKLEVNGSVAYSNSMQKNIDLDYGIQPIASIMEVEGLRAQDLVKSSTECITHKMVKRACSGRRLTPHVRVKILNALIAASGKNYQLGELFNYLKSKSAEVDI